MKEEKVLLNAVIVYLVRGDEVLLAMKTKKIGAGCWNGYGGGIEAGESEVDAVIRELREESGAVTQPEYLEKIAVVDFHNTKTDGTKFMCRCHVFIIKEWTGEIKATDEMLTPTWFKINNLPLEQMMPADRYWLLPALLGKKIIAKAEYGPFQKELLSDVIVGKLVMS
jgi:ADP-ribose pyrophosphatase YjhB (NUDIX family)